MKRIGLFILTLMLSASLKAAPPDITLDDGKIAFRAGYTPTFYEMAISTTIAGFHNFSDYKNLVTSKQEIVDKVLDLEGILLAYQDLQTRYPAININPRITKIKAQIDLLVGLYLSLP